MEPCCSREPAVAALCGTLRGCCCFSESQKQEQLPCLPPSREELGSFRTKTDGEKYLIGFFFFASLLSSAVLHREGRAEAVREGCLLSPGC